MRKAVIPVLLSTLLCTSLAFAGPMQAGLWEVTMKSDAVKKMPKLSPEQVAQMKKMGVQVPQMSEGAMTSQICVTPEMAAREQPPIGEQKDCRAADTKKSGNTYTVDIVCIGPDLKGKGTVKATYSGNTSFQSTYSFKGTSHGRPVSQSHESSGRWLGSDCGSVRPASR